MRRRPMCPPASSISPGLAVSVACASQPRSAPLPHTPLHPAAMQSRGTRATAPRGAAAGWACATTSSTRVGWCGLGSRPVPLRPATPGSLSIPCKALPSIPAAPAVPHPASPALPTPRCRAPAAGAYYLNLLWNYFLTPGLYRPDALISEPSTYDAANLLVDVWVREQRHNASSPYRFHELSNGGLGPLVDFTGAPRGWGAAPEAGAGSARGRAASAGSEGRRPGMGGCWQSPHAPRAWLAGIQAPSGPCCLPACLPACRPATARSPQLARRSPAPRPVPQA